LPSFQFTLISARRHDVGLSVVLGDLAAARAHAEELAKLAATRGYPAGSKVQVTDSRGVAVLEVPVPAASR